MSNRPTDTLGWGVVFCAVAALAVCAFLGLLQTPIQRAASRLRIGMTTQEVAEALAPEISWHARSYWEGGFTSELREGLRMTFIEDRLVDKLVSWQLGPPHTEWKSLR
jgi:hypothetical protein